MMTSPVKFQFDNDFGRGTRPGQGPGSPAMAEAEARGYRNGQAAGRAEATATTTRALASAMGAAAAGLERLAQGLNAIEGRLEAEAVEVAVAVAGKLSAELLRREPFAEVAALAAECFRHLIGVPHVVVRVNDAIYEEARTRLDEIANGCGFGGRVVVLSEPDIAVGDCRIEWADGGAARSSVAVKAAVAEAVERYLAVRRQPGDDAETQGAMFDE